jgi:predicted transcriptional regulator
MTSHERMEIRANIKFCADLGKTPTETYKLLQQTKRESSVSRALVFKWHKRFSDGRTDIKDDERPGRNAVIRTTSSTSIKKVLEGDRRLTVREIAEIADVSRGTVHRILTEDLNMKKVF